MTREEYDLDHWELHGDERPKHTPCDAECAAVNHCGGMIYCKKCGDTVCGCEASEDGLCPDCDNYDEDFTDEEQEL